jgi:hypothetical protein
MAFLILILEMILAVSTSPFPGRSMDDLGRIVFCARKTGDNDLLWESAFDLDPAPDDATIDLFPNRRPDADLPFSLRFSPVIRWLSGHVSVRENAIQGSRLDLDRDLGLRTAAGANVEFEIDRPSVQFQTEVEELFGWGGHSARQVFNWNGTTFVTPAQVHDHSSFLTVRPTLAVKALASATGDAWLGPVVGLEYPYYTVSVRTNQEKGSLEDWVHYLPYPVIGMAGHVNLAEALSLSARCTAGYLPNVPAPYIEGGRLYVSARPSICLEVPLTWRLGPSFDLSCAVTYQYWSGRDHSVEDGNTLTITSPGIMLGLAYHW